jgi:predicted lipoprotein with Yx(FWY)xxD motif
MKTFIVARDLTFVLSAMVIGISCEKSSAGGYNNTSTVSGVVLTSNANFGNILTDNLGKSLYFFFNDPGNSSTCTGGCLTAWPVFYAANLNIGMGLSASDFGVIKRSDGAMQTTYKGWPLYYFSGDSKSGDVTGDKVDNTWAVAKSDYTVMVANGQLVGLDGMNYNDQSLQGTGISQYLTDPYGRALYIFTKDSVNTNKFTNSDFSNNSIWPIDQVATIGSIPSILDKSQFSTINVFGKTQLVCKNRPLYYFGKDDSLRGSTKGVSFPVPGAAIWKVINQATPILQ